MGKTRDIDGLLAGVRPPEDDLEARVWRSEVEARLFGTPPDPVRVGRYLILRRVGAGAVGVVFAAYDPELDRKVAIKLLHAEPGRRTGAEAGRGRLIGEAQALARLSHPNVVAVYDVGTCVGQVYLAMETRWTAPEPGGTCVPKRRRISWRGRSSTPWETGPTRRSASARPSSRPSGRPTTERRPGRWWNSSTSWG